MVAAFDEPFELFTQKLEKGGRRGPAPLFGGQTPLQHMVDSMTIEDTVGLTIARFL